MMGFVLGIDELGLLAAKLVAISARKL